MSRRTYTHLLFIYITIYKIRESWGLEEEGGGRGGGAKEERSEEGKCKKDVYESKKKKCSAPVKAANIKRTKENRADDLMSLLICLYLCSFLFFLSISHFFLSLLSSSAKYHVAIRLQNFIEI